MSKDLEQIVLDTNILISWLLLEKSTAGQVAAKAVRAKQHLASPETLGELADVLGRPKFDRYVTIEQRKQFLRLIGHTARIVHITQRIQICRDPKDDKFLELAVNGQAARIITGDRDLLALHPFRGITIQSPAEYVATL
jgi:uncharacterized protein